MSSMLQVARRRWAARQMTLTRWRKQPGQTFSYGETVCDLTVDGVEEPFVYDNRFGSDPECGIYCHWVDEGQEVGPWGYLLEYTDGPARATPARRPRAVPYRRRDRYPEILLNYRRQDTDAYAGRLHENLVREFGADSVFLDVFSIPPGEPFPWAIQQAAAHCRVVLSLIGTNWLTVKQEGSTARRVDYVLDFVRRELVAGLDRGIRVIPVLLPGAAVPSLTSLPEDLRGFEQLQALELSPRHWEADTAQLIAAIREELR